MKWMMGIGRGRERSRKGERENISGAESDGRGCDQNNLRVLERRNEEGEVETKGERRDWAKEIRKIRIDEGLRNLFWRGKEEWDFRNMKENE